MCQFLTFHSFTSQMVMVKSSRVRYVVQDDSFNMMSSLMFISVKLLFFNRPKVHKVRKPHIHLNEEWREGVIIGMKEKNASYRELGLWEEIMDQFNVFIINMNNRVISIERYVVETREWTRYKKHQIYCKIRSFYNIQSNQWISNTYSMSSNYSAIFIPILWYMLILVEKEAIYQSHQQEKAPWMG